MSYRLSVLKLKCPAVRDHYYYCYRIHSPLPSSRLGVRPLSLILSLSHSLLFHYIFILYILFFFLFLFLTGFNCFCPHADDTFQIQDWLRSNGNHDRGYTEFDYHRRIRPLSPVKRHRISNTTTDGRVPDRRRQLKSMESLLGLSDENLNGKHLVRDIIRYIMYINTDNDYTYITELAERSVKKENEISLLLRVKKKNLYNNNTITTTSEGYCFGWNTTMGVCVTLN